METFGVENFHNEAALVYVERHVESLVNHINHCFAQGGYLEREGELIPSVVFLTFLCERCGGVPPPTKEVVTWREKYLEWVESTPDIPEERRKPRYEIVKATFDKLEAVALFHDELPFVENF